MIATSRRAEVASALHRAGSAGVSGEAIAASLGVSRVAVSKHIAALRELGYEIAAAPRTGYRLESAPDLCIPEEVARRLRDPLWVACEGGATTASTNDDAKRLARGGAAEGTAVVAASQTGGRGRLGREWVSPVGGAYVSCVLRPRLTPAEIAPLPLVAAVGAARALESFGVRVGLKWPNDLEVDGRKLGGILIEMTAEASRVEWVVVGCGVNVAPSGHERAASVREHAAGVPVAEVAAAVLDGIAGAYREFGDCGFAPLRAEYDRRATLTGRDVTVRDAAGALVAAGAVRGIAEDGAMLLEADGVTARISTGEVTLRG